MLYDDVHVLAFNGNKLKPSSCIFPLQTSCRRTDLETAQSGSGLSVDQVSVWIRSGSVEVQGLSVGGFLVLSPRRFQNVCR